MGNGTKALLIVVVLGIVWLCCVALAFGSLYVSNKYNIDVNAKNSVAADTEAPAASTPTPVLCDPSTVAYPHTDRELDPNLRSGETLTGPGIVEWWDSRTDTVEGMWPIAAGETLHLLPGLRGHWFPLNSQSDLDCVITLHVEMYGMKPQHQGKSYDQLVIKPPLAE
jgi:hypothetical protein